MEVGLCGIRGDCGRLRGLWGLKEFTSDGGSLGF